MTAVSVAAPRFSLVSLLALLAQGAWSSSSCGCSPAPASAAAEAEEHHEPDATQTAALDDDPVRVKGLAPGLVIHRKRGDTIERLPAHAMARTGDLVQISYVAAGNRHGVILSMDDRGLVTLHHPVDVDASTALRIRGEQPLPHAYLLDDASGFERFVFVTSGDVPLDVATVMDAARSTAHAAGAEQQPLDLPSGWHQTSVTLSKSSNLSFSNPPTR